MYYIISYYSDGFSFESFPLTWEEVIERLHFMLQTPYKFLAEKIAVHKLNSCILL